MADAARSQRAAALEEKKRRLEELKARRNRRGTAADAPESATTTGNLEEYIDGLLSTTAPSQVDQSNATHPSESIAVVANGDSEQAPPEAAATTEQATTAAPPMPPPEPAATVKHVETFVAMTQTEVDDFPADLEQDEEERPEAESNSEHDGTSNTLVAEGLTKPPKVLSPEEMEQEVSSKAFSSFLDTASKKVERVLGAPVLADLFVNYVGETDGLESSEKLADATRFLSARQLFECPKWTKTRDVTDMDWSPLHRELMLSSYHMPSSSTTTGAALSAVSPHDTPSASLAPRSGELQSDGLALVWSLAMPTRPEHIFTCGSPVLTTRFHPTESPLILGGCQSGQLVIWDVRAGRLPVQRSSSKSHVHPINSMEITEGASGLATAATDGKINFWSLSNLRDAAESIRVDGHISCLAVAPESNSLVAGDEDGTVHVIQAQTTGAPRASKRPMRKLNADEGHFGMVTSAATKPLKQTSASRAGLSKGFLRGSAGLVLTSGVDWAVKLWAPAYSDKSLLSFVSHSYDYMCDVQWNPLHPSLFGTASSNGSIDLWNLASSLEEPSTSIILEPEEGKGLNKLKWSADGRRLLVASADRVHVLSLSDEVLRQKGDEEARLMKNLTARGLLLEGSTKRQ